MDKEDCDFYKPISKKDKICASFTGREIDISDCRRYCTTLEFKRMMEEGEVYERKNGRLRKK